MQTTTEDPRVVRSRALILEASRQVFVDEGYQATTVEQVAVAAGIAKRTIYNLYDDKDQLFRATILSAIDIADAFATSLAAEIEHTPPSTPELASIGRRLAEATLLGPALPLRRLLVMESARFGDLVTEYRRRAPDAVMAALAALFAAMMDAGTLRRADPALAAEHFAFLVMGAALDRAMFTGVRPSRAQTRTRADAGAEAFQLAYSTG